jgi:hypothetical protein
MEDQPPAGRWSEDASTRIDDPGSFGAPAV